MSVLIPILTFVIGLLAGFYIFVWLAEHGFIDIEYEQ